MLLCRLSVQLTLVYGPTTDGHRQADVLDPAHVVAGAVPVVEPLGHGDRAGAGDPERQQGQRIELAQRDVAGQLELPLVVVVVGHLHPLDVEMQRLAGQQALVAGVPVVELDELGRVELGPHQLPLHRLLRPPGGVAGEAVVLVVEAGQVALHPAVEGRAGELVLQEGLDVLRLLHLGLDGLVVVVGDLLGDQRGDDLPADLRQLARGEVRLQHPFVGAALVSGGARGDARLVLLPARDDLRRCRRRSSRYRPASCPTKIFECTPMPQKARCTSALGIGMSAAAMAVGLCSPRAALSLAVGRWVLSSASSFLFR